MKVVLFDFDGTLSSGDANLGFFCYTLFKKPLRHILFFPMYVIAFIGGKINYNGIWWRQIIRKYLTREIVEQYATEFIRYHKKNRFGWSAKKIAEEKALGAKVICISASPNYLIPGLVQDLDFDAVLCTETDYAKPWKIISPCHGKYKIDRLNALLMHEKIDVVRAYSDSKSDLPMMNLAKEQVWVNPKNGSFL